MLASIPGYPSCSASRIAFLTEVRSLCILVCNELDTFCVGSAFTIEAGVMYNRELPAIKSDRLAHVILLHINPSSSDVC
ncbi:hypothetical protein [Bacillus anthracis]|uniref:hypothetical protein n=1 Tax=Bacillus anthracis TaxID=1392 RepID=UPI001F36E5AE|nr:hypothetical protein [Bacillus anthracis]